MISDAAPEETARAGADPAGLEPAKPELPAAHRQSSRSLLIRNVSLLTGSQLLIWCVTLAWTLIVPRRLGAGQMGVYTLAQAATGILLVVVGLGLRPFLVREIAADRSRAPVLIGTAIVLGGILLVPALGGALIVIRAGGMSGDPALAVLLGWSICVFVVVSDPILAAFQAIQKMQYLAYSQFLNNGVVGLATICLALLGVRAIGILTAGVAMVCVETVLYLVWARSHFAIRWRVTPRAVLGLLRESLPYSTMAIAFTFYLWIDSLMLGIMTSTKVLGWYGLPTRIFGVLMMAPVILSNAWLPQLVQAYNSGPDALRARARPAMELVLVLSMPACVGTVLVAGPLIQTLYGGGFSGSVTVLVLLAFCLPPMYLNVMANQVMIASGRQIVWTRVMVVACVVNPIANLFLIPYFQRTGGNGAIGASIAMVVTEVVLSGIAMVLIRRIFAGASLLRALKGMVATAGMAVAVLLALRLGLVAGIAAGLVSFPLLALLLRVLSREERELLRSGVRKVTRRLRPRFA
ncbi:MAG TPA: flippase [Candidatus Binatia bacterium]|nr:flippase [Candidatus Binatia bacterium]